MLRLPRGIDVYDDWLNESQRTKLIETVNWLPMYFLNRSTKFATHSLDIHWYYPLAVTEESLHGRVENQLDALEEPLDIIRELWKVIADNIGGELGLYECSVSANTFGTEGNPHFDFRNRRVAPAHFTALVYCPLSWDITWAGETLFFDETGEITGGIMPKSGRIAIMRGDPYHVGRSVSRICPSDRRVVVFKFWDETMLRNLLNQNGE